MIAALSRFRVSGLLTAAGLMLAACVPANAAELILYTRKGCAYCVLWEREIGQIYPRTEEAARAPLRRVRTDQPQASDPVLTPAVTVTPTFVLMDQGREIGRFSGYTGDLTFWSMLEMLMRRLPPQPQPARHVVAE